MQKQKQDTDSEGKFLSYPFPELSWSGRLKEKTDEYGQNFFMVVKMMDLLSKNGFERVIKENQLDALLAIGSNVSPMFEIGGYLAITIPAGYDSQEMPFGICFGGLKGTEPKLIQIAYDFEQATSERKQPLAFRSHEEI